MTSGKSLPFRSWFYFRTGYSKYFVFVFGVLNTLTLTYYLAIDNYPALDAIFPSFAEYVALSTGVGLPLLILLGFVHMRRSNAYRSESEIVVESDPYMYKLPPGLHQNVYAPFLYEMLTILKKSSNEETISDEELAKIKDLDKRLEFLIKGGIMKRPENFGGL